MKKTTTFLLLFIVSFVLSSCYEIRYNSLDEYKEYIEKWGSPAYKYTPNLSVAEKISIYDQLQLNWNIFKNYIFENEKEIKELNKENLKKYPHLKRN